MQGRECHSRQLDIHCYWLCAVHSVIATLSLAGVIMGARGKQDARRSVDAYERMSFSYYDRLRQAITIKSPGIRLV